MKVSLLTMLIGLLAFQSVAQNDPPNKIIWTDISSQASGIYKANLDGTDIELIYASEVPGSQPISLAVDE
ncbi:MAG: hypothetical protein AAFV80_03415, partial [Bacteroidota bacterium]